MTTKTELLRTIRKHCLNCCSGSRLDVKNCASGSSAGFYSVCVLWPYRLGIDPDSSESRVEAGKKKAKFLHPDKIEDETINQTSISSGQVT